MRTRPNVPSVAMCTEQMDPICMKGDVPSVRRELRESSTGRFPPTKNFHYLSRKEIRIL